MQLVSVFLKCYITIYSSSLSLTLVYKTICLLESCRRESLAFMNMSPPGFLEAKTCLSQAKDRRCRIRGFSPWVGKSPQRRKWQPTPVFLPGKSHGRRSLVGHSLRGCKEHLSMHNEPHICWCPVSGSCRQTRGRTMMWGVSLALLIHTSDSSYIIFNGSYSAQ